MGLILFVIRSQSMNGVRKYSVYCIPGTRYALNYRAGAHKLVYFAGTHAEPLYVLRLLIPLVRRGGVGGEEKGQREYASPALVVTQPAQTSKKAALPPKLYVLSTVATRLPCDTRTEWPSESGFGSGTGENPLSTCAHFQQRR